MTSRKGIIQLTTLFLACFLISMAQAGVYTWVDENGVRQFSDRPPTAREDAKASKVQTIEIPQISTVQTRQLPVDVLPSSPDKPGSRKRVVMYSAEWCGVCKRAKRYFNSKGIAFSERDIDRSKSARKQFDKLGGRGVPLILVGNQKLAGFSAASFEQLYRQ